MIVALFMCVILFVLSLFTGKYDLGLLFIVLVLSTYHIGITELKKLAGEGSGDLLASGFLYPFLAVANTNIIASVEVWALLVIWLIAINSVLPQWKASKKTLFLTGVLTAILILTNVYSLVPMVPVLFMLIYKSRSNLKYILSFATGMMWLVLGFVLLHTASVSFAHYFELQVSVPTIDSSVDLMYFKYFTVATSIVIFLWVLYTYVNRHKWRPEIRYLISLFIPISILSIAVVGIEPLPAIIVSIAILHVLWNLQVRKGYFSPALLLSIIVMMWLNQDYLVNFLNLQH